MSTLAGYTISGHLHEGAAASLSSGLPGTLLLSGHERESGAPVVLKVARAEYPSPRELARLRHEYLILRSLSIPGVVKALGIERYGSGLALILEGVRGQPLSTYLRARRPDLVTAVRIALRLSEILHALHECGVSHRDIKPHLIRTDTRRPRFRSAPQTRERTATGARARRCGSIAPDPAEHSVRHRELPGRGDRDVAQPASSAPPRAPAARARVTDITARVFRRVVMGVSLRALR